MKNIFANYVSYLKDNPNNFWFKRKLYGWGWVPVKWQGWCVILAYVALIVILVISREKDIPGNPDSGSNILIFALPIIMLTILLFIIGYKKGEKLRWQWGHNKKNKF